MTWGATTLDQLAATRMAPIASMDVADRLGVFFAPQGTVEPPPVMLRQADSYWTIIILFNALRDQPASPRMRGSVGSVERPTHSKHRAAMRDTSSLRAPRLAPSATTISWVLCVWLPSLVRSSAWTSSSGCNTKSWRDINSARSLGEDIDNPCANY